MIHVAIGLFVVCSTIAAFAVASFFVPGVQQVDGWDILGAALGVILSGATLVVVRVRRL